MMVETSHSINDTTMQLIMYGQAFSFNSEYTVRYCQVTVCKTEHKKLLFGVVPTVYTALNKMFPRE